MTTKHTPGPWMLDAGGQQIRARSDYWPADVGDLIARVAHTEDVMGTANAALIAAAPDLLAACEEALAWFGRGDLRGMDHGNVVRARIAAAIKKARGGQ